jgi:thioesterase domain-containing protein
MTPDSIGLANHFLRDGGSSLAAMRMASDIRRECGFQLDIGAFLANPTFECLSALQATRTLAEADGCVVIGPRNFSSVVLLIPGALGHAAGLFALAQAIQERMPSGGAVAIFDLDAALESAPSTEPLWFVARRIVQLVTDIGPSRLSGMVGFSLGGLLALHTATNLGTAAQTPVWMLDSFAPRVWGEGVLRKIERRLAHTVLGAPASNELAAQLTSNAPLAEHELRASKDRWSLLGAQLIVGRVASPDITVNLIQARVSPMRAGLIWQRHNNGFEPRHFASWNVHKIDGEHMDLPRHLASSTARIILGH